MRVRVEDGAATVTNGARNLTPYTPSGESEKKELMPSCEPSVSFTMLRGVGAYAFVDGASAGSVNRTERLVARHRRPRGATRPQRRSPAV